MGGGASPVAAWIRALKVANNIDFYRYEVSFKLNKEQV